jgi:uncharacterized membrane protein YdcZ (DUF606 family)
MYAPPPSYNVATSNQFETGNMPQYGFNGINNTGYVSKSPDTSLFHVEETKGMQEIGKVSVMARCTNCQRDNFTRVESKVSSNGMVWAIICFCFGSWLLSFLVLCMEGFREFLHYCPSCNSIIATYKPKFSSGLICLLVLLTVGIIALQIFLIIVVVIPKFEELSRMSGRY